MYTPWEATLVVYLLIHPGRLPWWYTSLYASRYLLCRWYTSLYASLLASHTYPVQHATVCVARHERAGTSRCPSEGSREPSFPVSLLARSPPFVSFLSFFSRFGLKDGPEKRKEAKTLPERRKGGEKRLKPSKPPKKGGEKRLKPLPTPKKGGEKRLKPFQTS